MRDVVAYYAAAPERHFGRQIPVAGGIDVTFHEPLGVVGVIVPWNFPMLIAAWGFAPALAAGNTVVVKPAELTPLSALRLAELALEAGLPEDVLQVVTGTGSEVGWRLVDQPSGAQDLLHRLDRGREADHGRLCRPGEAGHPRARRQVGERRLRRRRPRTCRGQRALRGVRQRRPGLLRALADSRSGERLRSLHGALRAGGESRRGPRPDRRDKRDGPAHHRRPPCSGRLFRSEGAPVAFRGETPEGPGFWYPPTVLAPVDPAARAYREEIFGPVVAVVPFTDEAEAIRIANDTPYGLSGSIWTGDVGRALRVARAIETGNLSVNSHSSVRYSTPFGGFKQSGLGRELGPDALEAFSELKNVFIATANE